MFGHEVGFNLDGNRTITTIPGLLLTTVLITTIVLYGTIRLMALLNRANPLVTKSELEGYFDSSEVVHFDDIGFKVAFAVEQYDETRSGKDDPNYV